MTETRDFQLQTTQLLEASCLFSFKSILLRTSGKRQCINRTACMLNFVSIVQCKWYLRLKISDQRPFKQSKSGEKESENPTPFFSLFIKNLLGASQPPHLPPPSSPTPLPQVSTSFCWLCEVVWCYDIVDAYYHDGSAMNEPTHIWNEDTAAASLVAPEMQTNVFPLFTSVIFYSRNRLCINFIFICNRSDCLFMAAYRILIEMFALPCHVFRCTVCSYY